MQEFALSAGQVSELELPPQIRARCVYVASEDGQGVLMAADAEAAAAITEALQASPVRRLKAYAAEQRWRQETAGVTVPIGGEQVLISTQRGDDRAALHVTYSAIKNGLRADGATFNFADGRPRAVSNAEMEAAIVAALAHVQGAFDLGGSIFAAIEAGTITTTEQIDAAMT